jgi:hypothetical protein
MTTNSFIEGAIRHSRWYMIFFLYYQLGTSPVLGSTTGEIPTGYLGTPDTLRSSTVIVHKIAHGSSSLCFK